MGNPGAAYAFNRHNIGFLALDAIAEHYGFSPWKTRFHGATAEGLSESADSALVLKVPRKNGELTFSGDSGATVELIEVSDAGVCLDVEPYPDGVIEPLPATLIPLPKVVDKMVAPEHIVP